MKIDRLLRRSTVSKSIENKSGEVQTSIIRVTNSLLVPRVGQSYYIDIHFSSVYCTPGLPGGTWAPRPLDGTSQSRATDHEQQSIHSMTKCPINYTPDWWLTSLFCSELLFEHKILWLRLGLNPLIVCKRMKMTLAAVSYKRRWSLIST